MMVTKQKWPVMTRSAAAVNREFMGKTGKNSIRAYAIWPEPPVKTLS